MIWKKKIENCTAGLQRINVNDNDAFVDYSQGHSNVDSILQSLIPTVSTDNHDHAKDKDAKDVAEDEYKDKDKGKGKGKDKDTNTDDYLTSPDNMFYTLIKVKNLRSKNSWHSYLPYLNPYSVGVDSIRNFTCYRPYIAMEI